MFNLVYQNVRQNLPDYLLLVIYVIKVQLFLMSSRCRSKLRFFFHLYLFSTILIIKNIFLDFFRLSGRAFPGHI